MKGRLGLLRCKLKSLDREKARKMLGESLVKANGEATLAALLKLIARTDNHANLIGKLFVAPPVTSV